MAEVIVMRDWLKEKVQALSNTSSPIFNNHVCLRCNNGKSSCVRKSPTACEYPIFVVKDRNKLPPLK